MTEKWTAERMGRKGGSSKSEKKAAASRRNGLKGGRPKKEKKEGIVKAEEVRT